MWRITKDLFGGFLIFKDPVASFTTDIGVCFVLLIIGALPIIAIQKNPDAFLLCAVALFATAIILIYFFRVPFVLALIYPIFEYAFASYCLSMVMSLGVLGIILWLLSAVLGLIIAAWLGEMVMGFSEDFAILGLVLGFVGLLIIFGPMLPLWFISIHKNPLLSTYSYIFGIIKRLTWILFAVLAVISILIWRMEKPKKENAFSAVLYSGVGIVMLLISSIISRITGKGFFSFLLIIVTYVACSYICNKKLMNYMHYDEDDFFIIQLSTGYLLLPLLVGILVYFFIKSPIVIPLDSVASFQSIIERNSLLGIIKGWSTDVIISMTSGISAIFHIFRALFYWILGSGIEKKLFSETVCSFIGVIFLSRIINMPIIVLEQMNKQDKTKHSKPVESDQNSSAETTIQERADIQKEESATNNNTQSLSNEKKTLNENKPEHAKPDLNKSLIGYYNSGHRFADFYERCSGRYAYDQLKNHHNSMNIASYYNRIRKIMYAYYWGEDDMSFDVQINGRNYWYKEYLDCKRYSVSFEEAKIATIAAMYDNPLAYFAYTYDVVGNQDKMLSFFAVDYRFRLGKTRKKYSELIEKEVMAIVNTVPAGLSEEKKAQYVYDYISKNSQYDKKMSDIGYIDVYSHSIASYAEKHRAVCEGLSKTYQAVMLYLGIECLYVSGIYHNAYENKDYRHGWNVIKLNGRWRIVDLTLGANRTAFVNDSSNYKDIPEKERIHDLHKYQFKHPV